MEMHGLWTLLLLLVQFSLAEELITCAKACDSCGGPFPLDEQEVYCQMCLECGTATFTQMPTTEAVKDTTSRSSVNTNLRKQNGSAEIATRRIANRASHDLAIHCNGDHKCFYLDKLSKSK